LDHRSGSGSVSGGSAFPGPDGLSEFGGFVGGDLVALVPDGPGAVQVLFDEDLGLGVCAAAFAWGDVDGQSAEADAVVVADRGLIGEGDLLVAFLLGCFAEGGGGFQRFDGEALTVSWYEGLFQPWIGRGDIGDGFESEFGDEAVLENAEAAFDPALGLGGIGGNGSDGEFFENAADMGGELPSEELFFQTPVVVGAFKCAVAVMVDGQGDAVALQDLVQELEVGDGAFGRYEQGGQESAVGIVDRCHKAAGKPIDTEPVVGAAIPLDHGSPLGFARAAGMMAGWATVAFGVFTCSSEDPTDGLAAEGDPLLFLEHLREVSIVELPVLVLVEGDDLPDTVLGQGVGHRPAPIPVHQPLGSVLAVTPPEAFDLAVADLEQLHGTLQAKSAPQNLLQDLGAMKLPLTHDNRPLHAGHLLEGDIFSLQLPGTKSDC